MPDDDRRGIAVAGHARDNDGIDIAQDRVGMIATIGIMIVIVMTIMVAVILIVIMIVT